MTRFHRLAPGVALGAGWLLLSLPGGLGPLEVAAGIAAAAAGVLVARTRAPEGHPASDGGGPATARGDRPVRQPGPSDDPTPFDPARLPSALQSLLRTIAVDLEAERVVIWRVDRAADLVDPLHVFGSTVAGMAAAGSPLAWTAGAGGAVRLDPVPAWAVGSVVAAQIDGDRVLTVEREVAAGPPIDPARVVHAAGLLGPFLSLHDQQRHALDTTARMDRLIDVLRAVPGADDEAHVTGSLARAAMDVLDAEGSLVASWDGAEGTVLVREGRGGGPDPGERFGIMDGDLAHSARVASVVRREPGDRPPPLAAHRERWDRDPPYRVVIPLVDPAGATRGLLAAWGAIRAPDQAVDLLDALGPLLALQLSQASALDRFREQATADALTRLANRAALDDRLEEVRALFHRYRRPVALMVVDLDRFKQINDQHGHDAGDAVLRRVADVLRATIRDVDFPARFGGEELVVLLPETMLHHAVEVAERVREAIEDAVTETDGTRIDVTASIGVSACPECVDDPAELFPSADRALYSAKEGGRNQVVAAPTHTPAPESRG